MILFKILQCGETKIVNYLKINLKTRMHSNRMCTARLSIVSRSIPCIMGGSAQPTWMQTSPPGGRHPWSCDL